MENNNPIIECIFNPFRDGISMQSIIHGPHPATKTEETFIQNLLVILKRML